MRKKLKPPIHKLGSNFDTKIPKNNIIVVRKWPPNMWYSSWLSMWCTVPASLKAFGGTETNSPAYIYTYIYIYIYGDALVKMRRFWPFRLGTKLGFSVALRFKVVNLLGFRVKSLSKVYH